MDTCEDEISIFNTATYSVLALTLVNILVSSLVITCCQLSFLCTFFCYSHLSFPSWTPVLTLTPLPCHSILSAISHEQVCRCYFLRGFVRASLKERASILNQASVFLVGVSILKIIGGALLLTVFYPTDCDGVITYYPYICFLLGFLWLLRAYGYHKWAAQLSNARQPLLVSAEPAAVAYAVATDPKSMA